MKKYLLFDLDGTLTESAPGIINSVIYALDKFGIKVTEEEKADLNKFVGPPLSYSFKTYYGFSDEQAEEAIAFFREYYSAGGMFENRPYDGIEEVLAELKARGFSLIVATSKLEEPALGILKHFGLYGYFDFVAGSLKDNSRVSKAEVINYVLAHCGITDKSQAAMIGDREHDIIGAKTAGIEGYGVLYGYGSREELEAAGAVDIAQNPADILRLF